MRVNIVTVCDGFGGCTLKKSDPRGRMDITTWSGALPNLDFLDITFLVGLGVGSCLIWIIIDLKILVSSLMLFESSPFTSISLHRLRTTFKVMNFSSTQQTIPLPTIEEIKNNLSVPKNCALFYSGPGSYAYKARQWAKRKEGGHMVLFQLWKNLRYPSLWQNDADLSEEFFALASRAMAELASGTVHVMLPSDTQGTNWWRGKVWDLYEWPHLTRM